MANEENSSGVPAAAVPEQGGGIAGNEQQQQGDELEGNSLLTKPDEGGGEGGKPPDAGKEPGAKDDPADAVPEKPEGYSLKFAEGTQVDTELLAGFQKTAHEMGIKPSQAQKLASLYEAHVSKAGERMQAAQIEALETAKKGWEEEIQKSPAYKEEYNHARAALREYGSKELYDLLDQTNLGSHPEMWKFIARIGRALAEPGFHGKSSGETQERPLDARMWPDMQ